jgi:uncharacterized protein (DUF58 family)
MSRVKSITIKTKRAVFSSIIGDNDSIFNGEGYDFVELREYEPNDDIKKIDWIISAKLHKPYVKIFKETKELNIVIAPVIDGATYFGQNRFKNDLIAEIASILGYSSVKLNNNFQSLIFTDKLLNHSKPTKKSFAVFDMVKNILSIDPLNRKKNFVNISQTLFKRIKKKSIIFIISDFLDDNIDLSILAKKHEVIAIIVRDKFEENPYQLGDISLIDPTQNITIDTSLSQKDIDNYRKEIALKDKKLFKDFKKHRVKFTKIYTDEEPIIKLLKLFRSR